ncbi:9744_t:CDS:2, partial [Dentiscutata heterogama]
MHAYPTYTYLTRPGRSEEEAASIRANNLILPQFGLFYFEVHIIDQGNNG